MNGCIQEWFHVVFSFIKKYTEPLSYSIPTPPPNNNNKYIGTPSTPLNTPLRQLKDKVEMFQGYRRKVFDTQCFAFHSLLHVLLKLKEALFK